MYKLTQNNVTTRAHERVVLVPSYIQSLLSRAPLFAVCLLQLTNALCASFTWILCTCWFARPCLCADTSLHITPSWSQEVTTRAARLWGMEMLSALEEWHIEHREVRDIQGLGVIKQHCGSHHCLLRSHYRHKSLASGVWKGCHLEKCNVKTMSFQQILQNFPSTYTREQM